MKDGNVQDVAQDVAQDLTFGVRAARAATLLWPSFGLVSASRVGARMLPLPALLALRSVVLEPIQVNEGSKLIKRHKQRCASTPREGARTPHGPALSPVISSQVIQAGLGDTALFSMTSSCHTASLVLNG